MPERLSEGELKPGAGQDGPNIQSFSGSVKGPQPDRSEANLEYHRWIGPTVLMYWGCGRGGYEGFVERLYRACRHAFNGGPPYHLAGQEPAEPGVL